MFYITGDCHGDFRKFTTKNFPKQKELTKNDYVIICGDFGGIWQQENSPYLSEENYWLDWLNDKPFTTLFVSGNHENFDRLNKFLVEEWNGGKIQRIRSSIFHLMRGEIFEIDGNKIFVFGGAKSHDISDGIIENEGDWKKKAKELYEQRKMFRVNHISWWKEELPTQEEMEHGLKNLKKHDFKVDFIVSHCLHSSYLRSLMFGWYDLDHLTDYFDKIKEKTTYNRWYCGHYHENMNVNDKETILFDQIIKMI